MCQHVPNQIIYPLTKEQFVEEVMKSLYFIKAKPFESTLSEIFENVSVNNMMEKNTYQEIMEMMFSDYRWPRKTGQLRPSLQSPKYEPWKKFM